MNLYLATMIDCFSRRLAGWGIAEHMRTDLIVGALSAVLDTRGSLAGAIFQKMAPGALCHPRQVNLAPDRPSVRSTQFRTRAYHCDLTIQSEPIWSPTLTTEKRIVLFGSTTATE